MKKTSLTAMGISGISDGSYTFIININQATMHTYCAWTLFVQQHTLNLPTHNTYIPSIHTHTHTHTDNLLFMTYNSCLSICLTLQYQQDKDHVSQPTFTH